MIIGTIIITLLLLYTLIAIGYRNQVNLRAQAKVYLYRYFQEHPSTSKDRDPLKALDINIIDFTRRYWYDIVDSDSSYYPAFMSWSAEKGLLKGEKK